jgi:hypothetical protein
VWRSRTVHKLFRRSFLERLGLRFDEDLPVTADQVFMGHAYFEASVVSVLASYDCYFQRNRPDGKNFSITAPAGLFIDAHLTAVERMRPVVMRRTEPGPFRDHVSRYHFQNLARRCLGPRFLELGPAEQATVVMRIQAVLPGWYTASARAGIEPRDRIRLHLAGRGSTSELVEFNLASAAVPRVGDVVSGGRILATEPFLRDARIAVPDECYDVTDSARARARLGSMAWHGSELHVAGHAFIEHVDTIDQVVEVVLREKGSGAEVSVRAAPTVTPEVTVEHGDGIYDYDRAGFTATVDVSTVAGGATLPPGRWEVLLRLGAQGLQRETRLRADPVDRGSAPVLPSHNVTAGISDSGGLWIRVR